METLRHHDARLEQNRVREIREVFISLRQLIRVVTNRYLRFPTICNFFGRNIYEWESAEKLEEIEICGKTGIVSSEQKLLNFFPITFINELTTYYFY